MKCNRLLPDGVPHARKTRKRGRLGACDHGRGCVRYPRIAICEEDWCRLAWVLFVELAPLMPDSIGCVRSPRVAVREVD
eukprot:5188655-Karenia_brevis.AAC.1